MALTSANTPDEIVAQYIDNSLYDLNNSANEARLFIQACRIILVSRPESMSSAGLSQKFNIANVGAEAKKAEAFLVAINGTNNASMVRRPDLSNIRGR